MKILIIDDSKENIHILASALRRPDLYGIMYSMNAAKLEAQLNTDVGLIILDIMLPLKSGLDILLDIRKGGYGNSVREVPVMIYTALHDESLTLALLKAGAADVILKTTPLDIVSSKVIALLRTVYGSNFTVSSKIVRCNTLIA